MDYIITDEARKMDVLQEKEDEILISNCVSHVDKSYCTARHARILREMASRREFNDNLQSILQSNKYDNTFYC